MEHVYKLYLARKNRRAFRLSLQVLTKKTYEWIWVLALPTLVLILTALQVNTALNFMWHQLTTEQLQTSKMVSIGHVVISHQAGLSLNPRSFHWKSDFVQLGFWLFLQNKIFNMFIQILIAQFQRNRLRNNTLNK